VKVLIVEDEEELASMIAETLQQQMFAVEIAYDGEQAFYYVDNVAFDFVILDVLLPINDGWSVLQRLREIGLSSPVLMLTALDDIESKVRGFDLGADDYLAKPFDMRELLARVNTLLRRVTRETVDHKIRIADLVLDTSTRKVTRSEKPIELRRKEYQILYYMMSRKNQVVTKEELESHLWAEEEVLWSDVLRTHIKNLRAKIDGKHKKKLIRTIRGVGYAISDE
jgi:DNA-binding response OmpR family regulator